MHSKKVRRFLNNIDAGLSEFKVWRYHKLYTPLKAFQLRHKRKIRVVFALADLGAWKTELLYKAMTGHKRFVPILAIIKCNEEDDSENLIAYFESKGYKYFVLNEDETICDRLKPDIIFWQKPYERMYVPAHMHHENRRAVHCHVIYSLRSTTERWATHLPHINLCWQVYYENQLNLDTYRILNENHAANGLATGLPVMDEMLTPKEQIGDPWKKSEGKKRIIYAPHHSINPENWMQLSTFLSTGKIMLELAEKYSDKVQWAFKPHPLLREKLERYWGKEETDAYYNRWATAEWSQFESGTYLGLFKHSDALIHDCGSFTMEYMFIGNPVMYLMKSTHVADGCNEMHKRALALHYQAFDKEGIEQFILNVINGKDPLLHGREEYVRNYLIPPGGHTACENIIAAILGK